MNDMIAMFYGHVYFIEDNERFKLGGEDLEKLKNFQIFKIFKIFKLCTILKLLFFKFLLLLTP